MPKPKITNHNEFGLNNTTIANIARSLALEINRICNEEIPRRWNRSIPGILEPQPDPNDESDPFIEEHCTWPPNHQSSDNSIPATYARSRKLKTKPIKPIKRHKPTSLPQLSFDFMLEEKDLMEERETP